VSVASGSFIFSEVPGFKLAKDAVYDNDFTKIDQPDGCLAGDTSTTLVNGLYGCKIGSPESDWFGRFIPHHFTVTLKPACSANGKTAFTYSGQPFLKFEVTAMNGQGIQTLNYDTSLKVARDIKLTEVRAAGQAKTGDITRTQADGSLTTIGQAAAFINGASIPFASGAISRTDIGFKFTDKKTAPANITLRAEESGLNSDEVSSKGYEDSPLVRSGQLKLSAAFGAAKQSLAMAMQTQYWSGQEWLTNTDDDCTKLAPANFALSSKGEATTLTSVMGVDDFLAGAAALKLASTGGVTATIDVAANLGRTANDASCLAWHGGTGAGMEWLRSQNGDCEAAQGWISDPYASITYGAPNRRAIHSREVFR